MLEPDPDLERRVRGLPDDELARMLFLESGDYREEALEIARAEAEQRGLRPTDPPPLIERAPTAGPETLAGSMRMDRAHPLWPGFAVAGILLGIELCAVAVPSNLALWNGLAAAASISGGIYWFGCVHRIHSLLQQATAGSYPVTPVRAVGYHFIPFFNLYWIFAWPRRLAAFLASQPKPVWMSGILTGSSFVIAILIARLFDGAIGLALQFTTMSYVYSRIRRCFPEPSAELDWSSNAPV